MHRAVLSNIQLQGSLHLLQFVLCKLPYWWNFSEALHSTCQRHMSTVRSSWLVYGRGSPCEKGKKSGCFCGFWWDPFLIGRVRQSVDPDGWCPASSWGHGHPVQNPVSNRGHVYSIQHSVQYPMVDNHAFSLVKPCLTDISLGSMVNVQFSG